MGTRLVWPNRMHTHAGVDGPSTSPVAVEVAMAGALAGLLGGAAMGLFATTYAGASGMGFWTPLKAVAAMVFGSESTTDAGAAVVGAAIHVLTSVTIGIVFAWVTPRDVSLVPALAAGAFAGVSLLVVMNLLILPMDTWTAPAAGPRAPTHLMWGNVPGRMPVPAAFVAHFIFGLGLGLAPGLRRRFAPIRPTPPSRSASNI